MKRKDYKRLMNQKKKKRHLTKAVVFSALTCGAISGGLFSESLLEAYAAEEEVGAKITGTGTVTYVNSAGETKVINVGSGEEVKFTSTTTKLTISINGVQVASESNPTKVVLDNIFVAAGSEITIDRMQSVTGNNVTANGSFDIRSCTD